MGNKKSKPKELSERKDTTPSTPIRNTTNHNEKSIAMKTATIEIPTWMKCKHYPITESSITSNLVAINKNEYVSSDTHALYKYNRETNKWTAYKLYPKGFNAFTCYDSSTISFDEQTNSLYIFNRRNKLLKINVNKYTHATTKNSMNYKLFKLNTYLKQGQYNEFSSSIFVNSTLHIIGGKFNNKHYTFNEKRQFKQIHKFKQHKPGFSKHVLIHLKTQNILLLFGGWSQNNGYLNSIYSFSLSNQRWSKLRVTLPWKAQNLTCVVTGDEKHVILLANEMYGFNAKSEIWVMNLRTFECTVSDVQIPKNMKSPFRAVLMDNYSTNKLLIYGFLKNIWNSLGKMDLRFISKDSMSIICKFYGDDDVHVVDIMGNHYKIKLENI